MKRLALAIFVVCVFGSPLIRAEQVFILNKDIKKDLADRAKVDSAVRSRGIDSTMDELRKYLDRKGYDSAVKRLMGGSYKVDSIFDLDFRDKLTRLDKNIPFKRLVEFFLFGRPLSKEDQNIIFSSEADLRALQGLKDSGLILEDKGGIRMNGVSVLSYDLGYGEKERAYNKMYIISDQPKSVSGGKTTPTGEVSTTSHILLGKIESLVPGTLRGIGADFGSGVGIQAIALLKTQPLDKVYGLEIDKHAMNLSELNAKLNGVGSRFEVIDNSDPKNLDKVLKDKKLDVAVSNPPFNIVPEVYEKDFGSYGGGGPEGLDVTKIFLEQIKGTLTSNGHFIFYSQLGRDKNGKYALEKYIQQTLGADFEVNIVECDYPKYRLSQSMYAEAMARVMGNRFGFVSRLKIEDETKASLEQNHIDWVVPAVVDIQKRKSEPAIRKSKSALCAGLPLAASFGPLRSPGGAFEVVGEKYERVPMMGGAFKGGAYLQEVQEIPQQDLRQMRQRLRSEGMSDAEIDAVLKGLKKVDKSTK